MWCDYVNFDARLMMNDSFENQLENSQDSNQDSRKKNLTVFGQPDLYSSQYASSSKDISQHLYEKPTRICNITLLDPHIVKG